ncbi:Ff.00g130660.m01.CDS01 [Fusarium sp. VM40]|nr:Ff.00g130660.m01.CDS01 [Fusarium sp. VM40]
MSAAMTLEPIVSLGQMPDEILLEIATHMPRMTQKSMDGITRTSKKFRLIFLRRYLGQITFVGTMERISHRLDAFNAVHASSTGPIWSSVRTVRFYISDAIESPDTRPPDTTIPGLVGDFLSKVAAVKEVSVHMAKPPPGQTTFQEFLGDANSSWTGFPKLKLTTPDTKIIHAVIRLCPQSALQVIKLPLYPNSPELRLLTRQCPNLKRLHVDAPGSFSFRNARGNWLVDDICGAFVHLEWLVLGGIFDSDIERLSSWAINMIIAALNSAPSLVCFAFRVPSNTDTSYMDALEQILTSVPKLEELCFISQDSNSPERLATLHRGSRKPGRSKLIFTQESMTTSERERRFPCALFGK